MSSGKGIFRVKMINGKKYRRRVGTRQSKSSKSTALAVSNAKKIKKLYRQIEYKRRDLSITGSVTQTGQFFNLTNISIGDGDINQRDGDKIHLTSVIMRAVLESGDTRNNIRMVLFKYMDDDQNPILNEIFQVPGGANGAFPHTWLYNLDHMRGTKKYRIVSDKTIRLNPNDVSAVANKNIYLKRRLNQNVQFVNGNSIGYNSLFLLLLSDSTSIPHPTFNAEFRLNYNDL